MFNYLLLKNTPLFIGMEESDVECFIGSSKAFARTFAKKQTIIAEGDMCESMGIVLSGEALGETLTEDGRRNSVTYFSFGDVFGDILAMSNGKRSPVTVTAATDCKVLFIPFEGITNGECKLNSMVFRNLAYVISQKYLSLLSRVNCLSKTSIREKVMCYLHIMSVNYSSKTFSIKLTREELADFLSVDRSALSRELSKMKKDGLIDYNKNTFTVFGGN